MKSLQMPSKFLHFLTNYLKILLTLEYSTIFITVRVRVRFRVSFRVRIRVRG